MPDTPSQETISRAFQRARRPSPQVAEFLQRAKTAKVSDHGALALVKTIIIGLSMTPGEKRRTTLERILSTIQPRLHLEALVRDIADFAADLPDAYHWIAGDLVPEATELIAPLIAEPQPATSRWRIRGSIAHDLSQARHDIARAVAGAAACYAFSINRASVEADTSKHISRQSRAINLTAQAARAALERHLDTPLPERVLRIATGNQARINNMRDQATVPDLPCRRDTILRARRITADAIDDRYLYAIANHTPGKEDANNLDTIAYWDETFHMLPTA